MLQPYRAEGQHCKLHVSLKIKVNDNITLLYSAKSHTNLIGRQLNFCMMYTCKGYYIVVKLPTISV